MYSHNFGDSLISTHTLARRVTCSGVFGPLPYGNFNPHPRTEGDGQGGTAGGDGVISTHTLARRVTENIAPF